MEQMNLSQYRRENLHLAHTEKNTGDAPHQSYLPLRRLRMNIIDVSGVRLSLRPKDWNELFDNTTSIIFVANLADYDQALENNPTRTRLDQSLEHFRVLVNSSRLKRASVILFLINQHEFEQNLTRSPLSCHFPGYGGGDNLMNATQYILGRFLDCNHAGLSTFAHVVEMDIALNFEVICAAIKETVLRNTLLNSKILHM
ncbi:hypothetical protein EJ08DRAFT_271300 [Tothia fuscella]|uniref:Uncharacterized protein n=1 Tax=Tothia fuscella TaxID=1048955 RepID=A0A9P4NQU7_9PEZI|nr:hypothetical protein EJ08DRAFT_271300 [Tothia fuscella]